ncbi:hypothetical protein SmJEL517_g04344 [Synchytrium microbalum]|uniref:Crinkler effector protein N-terminal domain-containing protein n=1 Tax=Synchytrium microbalum TaxID=1806994 RepID=A0A507C3I5_9FUNG|nr:uncharacterized protein SmJEL517_g04344 [Synchytrium microbalum]TPX32516.1 hypothetical protein SmJEL517_g04344 [Synchytrium microbalum]
MSDTTVLWILLFKRDAEDADESLAALHKLGDATRLKIDSSMDVDLLRKYLINHGDFKDRLADVKPDQLYVYMDAECKTPLGADTSLNAITTSAKSPLRVVRPAPPVSRMSFTMETPANPEPKVQAMRLLYSILWNKRQSTHDSLHATVVCNVPTLATMQQVGEFDTATTTLSPLSFTVIQLKDLLDKFRSQGLLGSFPLFNKRSAADIDKLLVNQEYRLLHEFLKRISAEGIVKQVIPSRAILGNPGIGKSIFLLYILIERLLDGLPTALQTELSCYHYFDHSGVVMNPPSRTCPSDIGNPTWALVDSNEKVATPCEGFLGNDQVLMLQATSPKVERYREWTKQAAALLYYMNTWTWEETAFYGSEVLHLDMNRIWEAWNDWNPCPRYCFSIAKSEALMQSYQKSVIKTLQETKQNLLQLLLFGSSANPDQSSKLILLSGAQVQTAEAWSLGRIDCKVEIIGKQVIRMMSEEMETRSDVDRSSFYHMLGSTSGEAAVRGMMLEARMHHLMSTKGLPLTATCLTDKSELLVAPTEKVVRFVKTDLSAMLKDNEFAYFWPIASNHASFDGFIWDRKTSIIILLQATVSGVHPIKQSGIKQTGLEQLRKAFRDAGLRIPEYPWPLVICTSINELGIQTAQQVQGVWNTRLTQYTLKIPI